MTAPAPVVPLYRVRKSATDATSQIGAYHILESAKTAANTHPGYSVYDENGKLIYTPVTPQPASAPVKPVTSVVAPVVAPIATPTPIVTPALKPFVGTAIMGKTVATANQCDQYIRGKNSKAPLLGSLYAKLGDVYGVRADVAFAQMCLETGDYEFLGRDPISSNNPAGLGATDGTQAYNVFDTIDHGVEAQFQHLLGYATTKQLPIGVKIYDQRFQYVHRGSAPWVEWLGIGENPQHVGWASDPGYGSKVLGILSEILKMPDVSIGKEPPVTPVVAPVQKPVTESAKTVEPASHAVVDQTTQPELQQESVQATSNEPTSNGGFFHLFLKFMLNFFNKLGGRK